MTNSKQDNLILGELKKMNLQIQELSKRIDNLTKRNTESTASDDELYKKAKEIVVKAKFASASLLQRRLRIGYARAARLLDMLEDDGVISGGMGAKPRKVLTKKLSI